MKYELIFAKNHCPDSPNPILFYISALRSSYYKNYKDTDLEGTNKLDFAKPFELKDAGDHILKSIQTNKPFVSIFEHSFNSRYYEYNDEDFFNNPFELSFIALDRGSRLYQDLMNTEICEDEEVFL